MISPEYFGCPDHWRQLGPHTRAKVYAMYNEWQSGQIGGEELRRRQDEVIAGWRARFLPARG